MNPTVKSAWLAALRSGEYEQARNYLKADGKFCCLGVLCDISGVGEWDSFGMSEGVEKYHQAGGGWGSSGSLPLFVEKWAGLSVESDLTVVDDLVAMNDDQQLGFEEIADAIEERL